MYFSFNFAVTSGELLMYKVIKKPFEYFVCLILYLSKVSIRCLPLKCKIFIFAKILFSISCLALLSSKELDTAIIALPVGQEYVPLAMQHAELTIFTLTSSLFAKPNKAPVLKPYIPNVLEHENANIHKN